MSEEAIESLAIEEPSRDELPADDVSEQAIETLALEVPSKDDISEQANESLWVPSKDVLPPNVADTVSEINQLQSFETLPANHPLLAKFQAALRAHLLKVTAELKAEIADIDHTTADLNGQREEIGANLYDLQHEIDRQKETLDSYNSRLNDEFEKRVQCEEENRKMQNEFKSLKQKYTEAQREHNDRAAEMRKLQALEMNVKKWHQEMSDEIEVSKRMVSRDKQEKLRQSEEKRKMDFMLLSLDMEVQRREAEAHRITQQIEERQKMISELNASITNATTDLEALESEHKRLVNSCNDVLRAVERRDKALLKTKEKLAEEKERRKNIQTEVDGTRKDAQREMERNETLERTRQRLDDTVNRLEKQLAKKGREHEALQMKIAETMQLIEATEMALKKATVENHMLENELNATLREQERLTNTKMELEDKILSMLQDHISSDQASKARARTVRELHKQRRERELVMANTEEQLSNLMFELEKLKGIVAGNRARIDELTKEKAIVDGQADEYDNELNAVKKSLESMARQYDVLNKRLAKLIEAAGGEEKSPQELKIAEYERLVNEMEIGIREKQKEWLGLQNNLVRMAEQRTQHLNDIHLAKNQLIIINQKSLKVEKDLADVDKEDRDLVREIKNVHTKMNILSAKLWENRQKHENELNAYDSASLQMTGKLKDSELAVLRLEEEIRELANEIEELKARVMDQQREALAWETKYKLVNETKRQRDQEYARSSEIGMMESEIHRMEVRLAQLKRAQEKLVHDMEISVQHRDHIFDAATLRSKLQKKNPLKTTPAVNPHQNRVKELKTKLKQVIRDTKAAEDGLAIVRAEKERIENEVAQINQAIQNERMQYMLMRNEIEETNMLKQENLANIVRLQQHGKRYRTLASAKELPKLRSESAIDDYTDRQKEICDQLTNVLEDVLTECPDQKVSINRILHVLKSD